LVPVLHNMQDMDYADVETGITNASIKCTQGLVVPVLHNMQDMDYADVETGITNASIN
jgi:hypothetical protein